MDDGKSFSRRISERSRPVRTHTEPRRGVEGSTVYFVTSSSDDAAKQEALQTPLGAKGLLYGHGWLVRRTERPDVEVAITIIAHNEPMPAATVASGEHAIWSSPAPNVRFDGVTGWPSTPLVLYSDGPWDVVLTVERRSDEEAGQRGLAARVLAASAGLTVLAEERAARRRWRRPSAT